MEQLTYLPVEPVDTMFLKIDDLAAIAEITTAPLTAAQKINLAYIIFQKCHIFKSALQKWDDKPLQNKTWENFKDHFRSAHKALC